MSRELKQAVYDQIDRDIDEHVERLRSWIQQPSISNTGEGIVECANMTAGFFRELGCQHVEIDEIGLTRWGSIANPVVFGHYDAGAPKTVIIYMMYDTMPVGDLAAWSHPPHAAELVEWGPFPKVLMGRGAINSKGPQCAALNALFAIKAANGELPVNVFLIAEGDEERMSIGLHEFIHKNAEKLSKADAMLGFGWQDIQGIVKPIIGSEGCLYIELTTSGSSWGRGPGISNIHGTFKRTVDSVTWRHVEMLNTFTADNGNRILVDGWYDAMQPPTPDDERMIDLMVEDVDLPRSAERLGIGGFIPGKTRRELLVDSIFGTSFNMDGIWSGLMTPGTAGSIMPNTITSKHNCRYVPDQDGTDLLRKIRAHLDQYGYEDVEISVIGDVPWVTADYETDIARSLFEMFDEFGVEYRLTPGTGAGGLGPYWPAYLFARDPLTLPIGMGMLGHGHGAHMINEYYVIEGTDDVYGIAGAEKGFAATLYNYAMK